MMTSSAQNKLKIRAKEIGNKKCDFNHSRSTYKTVLR